MATITTLRPSSTSSGVGWTPSTSTLHGVTSDDSDATYATWGGSGSALILGTPIDSPPVGERRHQVRLRARGEDGNAWWAVRLSSGSLVAGAAAEFTSSPGTITGSWGFGAPADGSTVLYTYVTGQSTGVRIQELYLDVDSRLAPVFTPQVLDGSGSVTTTINDTSQPSLQASAVDLDDLSARQYRYWVTLGGATVWDTGVTGGSALTRQVTVALDNGEYVAHFQVWSTLAQNTAYASDEETVTFTVAVGTTPAPDNPVVSPVPDSPFYELEVCAPYTGDFDDDQAWLEIERVDCPIGGSLLLSGTTGAHASTPSTATFTDLEVTVRAGRDDGWAPGADQILVARYLTGTDLRGFIFGLDSTGVLYLTWSPDGTFASQLTVLSTAAPVIDASGAATVRAYLDVDDGAGGYAVTFEQQDTEGDWHLIGEVVTNEGGGTTVVFQDDQPLEIGSRSGGSGELWTGRIYSAQFRDGRAGAIFGSPVFTGWTMGTMSIIDDQGNTWTVWPPAQITSDQRLVSVAILGPLETAECTTYIDYTLPRTGVGVTCDHVPDLCCSYYRARTLGRVDGQLQISNWSDAFDPGVPNGMIFMWPSTVASIPAGWERVAELDDLYVKGVATAATDPGTAGGAATHLHTLPTHAHNTDHSHTNAAATSAAVGTFSSTPNTVGTNGVAATHTHNLPSPTGTATVNSGGTAPTVGTAANDPARLEVIFIESGGQPLGVPDGALGLSPDISLSGWADYADATGRFLRGAGSGADGGSTVASAIGSHTHTIGAHTHTGTSHTHTNGDTTATNSALALNTGPTSAVSATSHAHPVTITAADTASLASGGSGSSGASSLTANEPPFVNVRVQENTSGADDLPVGIIGVWRGSLGAIPDHWELCDGTGSKPDLIGQYPKGATSSIGTTGGSEDPHTHTSPSHTHTTSGHSHPMTIGAQNAATLGRSTTATVSVANGTHTHTHGNTASTTPTVGNATSDTLPNQTTEPPYQEVAFLQLMEEPAPPPEPQLFCLEWNDDEHLLRTEGPDGPIWVAVSGKFTWDVDRPFTSATGVMGGRYVTSAPPGGRNLRLATAVESEAELAALQAVLNRPLVLVSPSDSSEVWAAPVAASVRVLKIGRVRQVTADFIATGPQPEPQLADVG
jgi:hypothetical protein